MPAAELRPAQPALPGYIKRHKQIVAWGRLCRPPSFGRHSRPYTVSRFSRSASARSSSTPSNVSPSSTVLSTWTPWPACGA